ncbi:hypothetical protein HDU67_002699 [Dinochytrium kinnereticum]|nr:hypothetical protein HDU67_002699 [Dinochytrium kinnereticum]
MAVASGSAQVAPLPTVTIIDSMSFCLLLPTMEGAVVAMCRGSANTDGSGRLQDGAIVSSHAVKTANEVQVTGRANVRALNGSALSGQLGLGMVPSSSCAEYDRYIQIIEEDTFCLRCCNDSHADPELEDFGKKDACSGTSSTGCFAAVKGDYGPGFTYTESALLPNEVYNIDDVPRIISAYMTSMPEEHADEGSSVSLSGGLRKDMVAIMVGVPLFLMVCAFIGFLISCLRGRKKKVEETAKDGEEEGNVNNDKLVPRQSISYSQSATSPTIPIPSPPENNDENARPSSRLSKVRFSVIEIIPPETHIDDNPISSSTTSSKASSITPSNSLPNAQTIPQDAGPFRGNGGKGDGGRKAGVSGWISRMLGKRKEAGQGLSVGGGQVVPKNLVSAPSTTAEDGSEPSNAGTRWVVADGTRYGKEKESVALEEVLDGFQLDNEDKPVDASALEHPTKDASTRSVAESFRTAPEAPNSPSSKLRRWASNRAPATAAGWISSETTPPKNQPSTYPPHPSTDVTSTRQSPPKGGASTEAPSRPMKSPTSPPRRHPPPMARPHAHPRPTLTPGGVEVERRGFSQHLAPPISGARRHQHHHLRGAGFHHPYNEGVATQTPDLRGNGKGYRFPVVAPPVAVAGAGVVNLVEAVVVAGEGVGGTGKRWSGVWAGSPMMSKPLTPSPLKEEEGGGKGESMACEGSGGESGELPPLGVSQCIGEMPQVGETSGESRGSEGSEESEAVKRPVRTSELMSRNVHKHSEQNDGFLVSGRRSKTSSISKISASSIDLSPDGGEERDRSTTEIDGYPDRGNPDTVGGFWSSLYRVVGLKTEPASGQSIGEREESLQRDDAEAEIITTIQKEPEAEIITAIEMEPEAEIITAIQMEPEAEIITAVHIDPVASSSDSSASVTSLSSSLADDELDEVTAYSAAVTPARAIRSSERSSSRPVTPLRQAPRAGSLKAMPRSDSRSWRQSLLAQTPPKQPPPSPPPSNSLLSPPPSRRATPPALQIHPPSGVNVWTTTRSMHGSARRDEEEDDDGSASCRSYFTTASSMPNRPGSWTRAVPVRWSNGGMSSAPTSAAVSAGSVWLATAESAVVPDLEVLADSEDPERGVRSDGAEMTEDRVPDSEELDSVPGNAEQSEDSKVSVEEPMAGCIDEGIPVLVLPDRETGIPLFPADVPRQTRPSLGSVTDEATTTTTVSPRSTEESTDDTNTSSSRGRLVRRETMEQPRKTMGSLPRSVGSRSDVSHKASFDSHDHAASEWGVEEVISWLDSLGLREDIIERFRVRKITGRRLLKLTIGTLADMGIHQAGIRRSILVNIKSLTAQ